MLRVSLPVSFSYRFSGKAPTGADAVRAGAYCSTPGDDQCHEFDLSPVIGAMPDPIHFCAVGNAAPRNAHIVVVEEDDTVREFVNHALSGAGYLATQARCAPEAIDIFRSKRSEETESHLLLSDVIIGHGTGLQLAHELQAMQARLLVLLTTGYTDERARVDNAVRQGYWLLRKPFGYLSLLHAVRWVLLNG